MGNRTSDSNSVKSQSLRDRVRAAMRLHKLSQRDLSKLLGSSQTLLNKWLSDTYQRDPSRIEAKLTAWLEDNAPQEDTAPQVEFYETPTAEKVLSALAYCQANSDMGTVYGGPGVGKTRSARYYQSRYPNVWIATASPAASTVFPFLEELADAVGFTDYGGSARAISKGVRDRVRESRGLIIVDEAQHLAVKALEEIRSIHDATGVGLVLIGNERVYEQLTGGTRAAFFAQLYSRVGLNLHLRRPTELDIERICIALGVVNTNSQALLWRVAQKPGALRGAMKALALAVASAGGNHAAVEPAQLKAAIRNLGIEVS